MTNFVNRNPGETNKKLRNREAKDSRKQRKSDLWRWATKINAENKKNLAA